MILGLFAIFGGTASFALDHDLAAQQKFAALMLTVLSMQAADGSIEVPNEKSAKEPASQRPDFKHQNPDKFCPNRHEAKARPDQSRRGHHRGFYGRANKS